LHTGFCKQEQIGRFLEKVLTATGGALFFTSVFSFDVVD
jgi:hypothetical protein